MSLTVISPQKHVLKDTPTSRMFCRILGTDDMVTFFNLETGEWILAYWVNRLGRVVDEIEDLGASFEKLNPALVHQIRTCWGHVDFKKKKARLLSKHHDKIRKSQEDILQDQDRWDWAKKRLNGKVPYFFKIPVG